MCLAKVFQQPTNRSLQFGLSMPKAEENVSVIVPVPAGEPLPVVAMTMPAESVEPVSTVQDGVLPPAVVSVQVGAAPKTLIRGTTKAAPVAGLATMSPTESRFIPPDTHASDIDVST